METQELYTTAQASRLLSLHKTTILKLIKSGELTAFNISRGKAARYRIPRTSIDAYLERGKMEDKTIEG